MVDIVLPSIAEHAKRHSITPFKHYGQNFLFDSSFCDKVIRASRVKNGAHLLEIGPGIGGLTRSLIKIHPRSFIVIEKDARCIGLLEELRSLYTDIVIIHGDALEFDIDDYTDRASITKIDIIANLPYHICTLLIIKWLKKLKYINSITVILQKDLVDRICASHGNSSYGRLSIITQLMCRVERCFNISPKMFYPAPKVESAVLRMTPHCEIIDLELINVIEKITMFAFSKRRKMIKSSLSGLIPNIGAILLELGIDAQNRAQQLSIRQYLLIARALRNIK